MKSPRQMIDDSMFREILDDLFEGVYFVDLNRTILFWNKGAERITGYSAQEVTGSSCADNILVHVDAASNNLCRSGCPLSRVIKSGRHHSESNVYLHHKDGYRVPVTVSVSPVRNERGKIVGAVEIFRDTVSTVYDEQYIEDLKKAALLDFLTGLPNRRYIDTKLLAAMEERRRHGTSFSVLFIDIDRFKVVNDTCGHYVGDRVIKMVARTLESNMRAYNTLGRWGGEEFVAIVSHVSGDNIRVLGRKLCSLVENSFIEHEGNIIRVTVTIGMTIARHDDTIQSLLDRADKALYHGKNSGRNCSVFEGEVIKEI